jgi:hypothetical protein
MGAACSSCHRGGSRSRVAPAALSSTAHSSSTDPATAAAGLRTALSAAQRATSSVGRANTLTKQQAARLLDKLVSTLLAASGLSRDGAGQGVAVVASLPQLLAQLRMGCLRAAGSCGASGSSLEAVAAVAGPLAARLLECGSSDPTAAEKGARAAGGAAAGDAVAVPGLDCLVSWLHTLLYEQVSAAGLALLLTIDAGHGQLKGE